MATYTDVRELSNLSPNKAITEKMHLLLINSNPYQLQAQLQLFSKFESHISAVTNIHDALLLLKHGDFDLIVNDERIVDFNKNRISHLFKNN